MSEILGKSFTLHNQGGVTIPVHAGAGFSVAPGECVALTGESGAGKSTVMRMIYGNYRAAAGDPHRGLDMTGAAPREILALRRETLGYVSSSCAWCRGCRRSTSWPSRSCRWVPADEARARAARCWSGCASPRRSGRCRPPPSRAASSSA
jgi:energy-coupling factor transporter ATP-binding protein EcfA2